MLSCKVNNGRCQQLCNSFDGQTYCKCYEGFILGGDGVSCIGKFKNWYSILGQFKSFEFHSFISLFLCYFALMFVNTILFSVNCIRPE